MWQQHPEQDSAGVYANQTASGEECAVTWKSGGNGSPSVLHGQELSIFEVLSLPFILPVAKCEQSSQNAATPAFQ